ncbi:MAG: hypothetical protein KY429_08935 [Actinobacteria bacterium]|nr:hypothetical protein [Actinomycetota bacterium]
MNPRIDRLLVRVREFETEAHGLFAPYEASASRVVILDQTYKQLGSLNVRQDDLMRQALRCVENELYRAAHVMAWAAFMDFLEEKLESDGLVKLKNLRPNWKGKDMAEMREYVTERALLETTQPLGLCTKNEMKALISLLDRRNECAHPSKYFPQLNETLGYISELLQRLKLLIPKPL